MPFGINEREVEAVVLVVRVLSEVKDEENEDDARSPVSGENAIEADDSASLLLFEEGEERRDE